MLKNVGLKTVDTVERERERERELLFTQHGNYLLNYM